MSAQFESPRPEGTPDPVRIPELRGQRFFLNPGPENSFLYFKNQVARESRTLRPWTAGLAGSQAEESLASSLLRNPSTELSTILEKRAVFIALISRPKKLQELHGLVALSYHMRAAIDYLETYSEAPKSKSMRRGNFSNLQSAIANGLNSKNLDFYASQENYPEYKDQDKNSHLIKVAKALIAVELGKQRLNNLEVALNRFSNRHLSELASELQAEATSVPSFSRSEWLKHLKADDSKEISVLKERLEKTDSIAKLTGALCTIGAVILRDGWSQPGFNRNERESCQNTWHLDYAKRVARNSEKQLLQIANPIPQNRGLTLLCGTQSGGKSFKLESDFLLHSAGQSIGFIPATSGNLHIVRHLAYFDRAVTDSKNKLSSFGVEVQQWSKFISILSGTAKAFADETFSSTSWRDQFGLLEGIRRFLRARDVQLTLATHSLDFIEGSSANPECQVFHFPAKLVGDKIEFSHKLTPGYDDAHAVEIAEALRFEPQITERVKQYLGKRVASRHQLPLLIPSIEPLVETERELLKQRRAGLGLWDPFANELVPETGFNGEIDLVWKYSSGRYLVAHNPEGSSRVPRSFALSSDPDLHKFEQFAALSRYPHSNHFPTYSHVQRIICSGYDGRAQDLIERQRFFDGMREGDRVERLNESYEKLEERLWNFQYIARTGIHCLLTTLINESCQDATNFGWKKEKSQARLLATADFVCQVAAAEGFRDDSISELCKRLKAIIEIDRRYQDHFVNLGRMDFVPLWPEKFYDFNQLFAELHALTGQEVPELAELKGLSGAETIQSFVFTKDPFNVAQLTAIHQLGEQLHSLAKKCDLRRVPSETLKLAEKITHAEPNSLLDGFSTAGAIAELARSRDYAQEIVTCLREIDSTYAHQMANYYEWIYGVHFAGLPTGLALHNYLKLNTQPQEVYQEDSKLDRLTDRDRVQHETLSLGLVLKIALDQRRFNYCRVDFNETGEIKIVNGKTINLPFDEQIANDSNFDAVKRIEISGSPNMSGKTVSLKQQYWCIASALFSGYAPADQMTCPLIAQNVYLDRVSTGMDADMGAFGNDLIWWQTLSNIVASGQLTFASIDEAFSTTTRKYNPAFSFAGIEHVGILSNSYLAVSAHSTEFIDVFTRHYSEATRLVNFPVTRTQEGALAFSHKKIEGRGYSRGIDMAEGLGMHPEIISHARLVLEKVIAAEN